ncbi:MAG: hypothetical protein WAP03_11930 [Methylorubrum rhodinum]|uniref:hypothetical protein n=1 Tax=Methylorubrum rhodinum TaxID=29428 RepID=UPI003BAEDFC5
MDKDDFRLSAEVTALRGMVMMIAPTAFRLAGISPDAVEAIAEDYVKGLDGMAVAPEHAEAMEAMKAANIEATVRLYTRVAQAMRTQVGGDDPANDDTTA